MGQLRAALRTLALERDADPAMVLDRLAETNRALRITAFATAVFARLTRIGTAWQLSWAVAGHPPPLLVGPDGAVQLLDRTTGVALVPTITRPRAAAHLSVPDGSTLLMYTDGLVEHRGVNLSESIADLCRLAAATAGCPLDELCDRLLRYAPGSDDVALLAARVAGPTR
jgi:serine phosphatase RsbU (regulator of sigma subunit)